MTKCFVGQEISWADGRHAGRHGAARGAGWLVDTRTTLSYWHAINIQRTLCHLPATTLIAAFLTRYPPRYSLGSILTIRCLFTRKKMRFARTLALCLSYPSLHIRTNWKITISLSQLTASVARSHGTGIARSKIEGLTCCDAEWNRREPNRVARSEWPPRSVRVSRARASRCAGGAATASGRDDARDSLPPTEGAPPHHHTRTRAHSRRPLRAALWSHLAGRIYR